MKKLVKSSLVIIASLGLFGCSGNKTNSTSTPKTDSKTSANSNKSTNSTTPTPVTHTLAFEVDGTLKVGETVTVTSVTYDDATLLPAELANVTVAVSDTSAFEINGRKLKCLKAGSYTITITYSGTSATKDVTVEEGVIYSTVAEVRALAKNGEYEEVYVKGVITATSGTSAFLQDSTGGIFIYNFYFQSTDTACSNYRWQLGTTVEIHSYVTEYYGNAQLTYSYKDTSTDKYVDLDGRYANLSETSMTTPDVIDLDETKLKALTSSDAGKMYKFVATYEDGEIVTTKKSTLTFKVGDTAIKMITDGSSSKIYEKEIEALKESFDALGLEKGDEVEIIAPLSSIGTPSYFYYFGKGTSITKHYAQDTLYVKYTGEEKVGQTLTFSATYNGNAVTDVTYTATKGADLVTISNNTVTLNAVGDVTITATYMDGETEKTDTVDFTIASADPVAINTITATGDYLINGVVSGTCSKGFTVTDATGTIFVFTSSNPTVALGDSVSIDGTVSTYNGAFQFSKPTVTKLDDPLSVTIPDAIELTSTIADSLVKTSVAISDIVKYKWTTTVSKSGSNYLLNVDGSSTTIEAYSYSGTLEEGTTYELEGYYLGYSNGNNKYASVLLTSVKEKKPTEVTIKLDQTTASVEVGKTVTLTPTVKLPEGTTDDSVTWTTSDDTVATVANGVVTGVKTGEVTITATSVADTTKSASCTVTVTEATAGETVTITFDDNFNKDYTTITTNKVEKTTQDVTLTLEKAKSSTDIALNSSTLKYVNPLRVYKSQTLTLSSTKYNFVKMEFVCNANGTAQYGPGCLTASAGTYTYEEKGKNGTWTDSTGLSSVVFTAETKQVQVFSIKLRVIEASVSD